MEHYVDKSLQMLSSQYAIFVDDILIRFQDLYQLSQHIF